MRRLWATLSILGAANLVVAGMLAFSLPASPPNDEPENQSVRLRPYIVISPEHAQFERRVRPIVQTEIQDILNATGRTSTLPSPIRSVRQAEATGGPQQPTVSFPTRRGDVTGLSVNLQPRAALLTPFGVYSSGAAGFGLVILSFGVLLLGSIITMYLAPQRLRVVRDAVTASWQQRVRLGSVGLLAHLSGFLLTVVLTTLVIGIPVAALLILASVLGVFLGLVAVSLTIGGWLAARLNLTAKNPVVHMIVGILLLFPLGLIPLLGWALVLLISSLGFGAILVTKFGSEEGWSLDPLSGGDHAALA